MKDLFKVLCQTEPIVVQSPKAENGQFKKSTLTLQEIGGKYENTYVVTLLGAFAECNFQKDELVYAVLRFTAREYNGQMYQDIVANEIIKLQK